MPAVMNMANDLVTKCAALMAKAGLNASLDSISPCNAGGNNRTYRVGTSAGEFALKQYFRHAGDSRDRLRNEFAFLTYAVSAAPGKVPTPISVDHDNDVALYEFIHGAPYLPGTINDTPIRQAVDFFLALNHPEARERAKQLPTAAEACFSIDDHLSLIGARLNRLEELQSSSPEDTQAIDLVAQIVGRWQTMAHAIQTAAAAAGVNRSEALTPDQRCISPSDFGFHNALMQSSGDAVFLDFEYAGWDDPAKVTGDFFAQLAVPVPQHYFGEFVQAIAQPFANPESLIGRATLLRPAYQIKWCCIALNVFLPVNIARRKFANPNLDETALKRAQLAKASALFRSIPPDTYGLH